MRLIISVETKPAGKEILYPKIFKRRGRINISKQTFEPLVIPVYCIAYKINKNAFVGYIAHTISKYNIDQ